MRTPPFVLLLLASCEQEYQVVPKPPEVDPEDVTECPFTQVEDTDFYRYDCNPVFTTTGEGWAETIGATAFNVTEVLGHPFYQLWYTGLTDDDESSFPPYAMGYAVSPDGTEFAALEGNPVLEQGDKESFDADYMSGNQVVWDPSSRQYVMIWQGINDDVNPRNIVNGLGVGTSADGRDWTRFAKNPVFDFGGDAAEDFSYCWPLDLTLGEVSGYTGYMAGGQTPTRQGQESLCEVYRLNAGTLGEWKANETVVLAAGDEGEWDDRGMIALSVATLGGTRYMFYVGFGLWTAQGNYVLATHAYLGMATYDEDGERWKKEGDPIPVHLTEDGQVSGVEALTVGNRIHLWITDSYEIDGEPQQAVGYFLFDPARADAVEDTAGE